MNHLNRPLLHLSIVLPCYNPQADCHINVVRHYKKIKANLPPGTEVEIIIVDDGSKVPFSLAAKKFLTRNCLQFQLISYPENMGKGYAVRKGVEAARAPFVIYTDIDFPYTITDIVNVYHTLQAGHADLVTGTREVSYNKKLSPVRQAASNGCNYVNRKLLNLPYKDVQSGIKGVNSTGRELLLKTTIKRFLFDTEFIWLACSYRNVRIKALPVSLRKGVAFTSMKSMTYVNEAGNFCRLLLKDKLLLLRRFDAAFKAAVQSAS